MVEKKFLAYAGKKFTIEWYFDSRGKSCALEYFETLSCDRQRKLLHLFFVLGEVGKIFNKEKFRNEGNQVYALKTSPDRFLCFFFERAKVIVTNAYEKKSAKMPRVEKDRAISAKEDYLQRCKERKYYDKEN